MTRLTITVPEEVAARLKREARRRHVSISGLVRERLSHECAPAGRRAVPFAGIVNVKLPWNAAQIDEELARTWADDIRRDSFSDR
jgi:hypothetical protein